MLNEGGYPANGDLIANNTAINTIYNPAGIGSAGRGIFIETGGSGPTFFINNIIITTNNYAVYDADSSPNAVLRGNCYYDLGGTTKYHWTGSDYTTIAGFRSGSGQESGSGLQQNPPLQNEIPLNLTNLSQMRTMLNYRPATGSAILTGAIDESAIYGFNPGSYDAASNAVPSAPYAMGAYMTP